MSRKQTILSHFKDGGDVRKSLIGDSDYGHSHHLALIFEEGGERNQCLKGG